MWLIILVLSAVVISIGMAVALYFMFNLGEED